MGNRFSVPGEDDLLPTLNRPDEFRQAIFSLGDRHVHAFLILARLSGQREEASAFVLTFAASCGHHGIDGECPHLPDLSVEEALGVAEVAHILGVHPRTIERRRGVRRAPRPLEAQREEKLHRIWRELTRLFTVENAIYWLKHPVPGLRRSPPGRGDVRGRRAGPGARCDRAYELGHSWLMPDLPGFFRSAPVIEFSGTVYRICPARYRRNLVSMRDFLHRVTTSAAISARSTHHYPWPPHAAK